MKTELLRQLDGVGNGENINEGIIFIGATNAPWEIDNALRRRFEKRVMVPLPDYEARLQTLKLQMGDEGCTMQARYGLAYIFCGALIVFLRR